MKDRREAIVLKAIELYIVNGYNNVSITDLQAHLDIGRGTLYYYFKSKEELFMTVLDQFILTPKLEVLNLPDNVKLQDMINAMLKYIHSLESTLEHFENKNVNTSNVVSLLFTAYQLFPTLYRKASRIYALEVSLWNKAIRNSINSKEVRADIPIETVVNLFMHIKDGYDVGRKGVTMDFSIYPKQYNFLYDLIKA
ncbi:MAG: TetR/AcrR family transcriptional regulator [Paludibacteraceae bacterium]|jgi:AcrR family transcriptional regulator|nr:TetR/AcrR family transcriptional regulator [Paludibacteraceae bacterium]